MYCLTKQLFLFGAVLCLGMRGIAAKCPEGYEKPLGASICMPDDCKDINIFCEDQIEDRSPRFDSENGVMLVGCPICGVGPGNRRVLKNNKECPKEYPVKKLNSWCTKDDCELDKSHCRFKSFSGRSKWVDGIKLEECPTCLLWLDVEKDGCPSGYEKVKMQEDKKKEKHLQISKGRNTRERRAAEKSGYYCMPDKCEDVHEDCKGAETSGGEKAFTFVNAKPVVLKQCFRCGNKNGVDDPHWGGFRL